MSNQYKSELITQNYQEIFEKDILNCQRVHFIYSYLSQSEATWLVELSKKQEIQIVLLLYKKIANQPHLQSSLANIEDERWPMHLSKRKLGNRWRF